MTGRGENQRCRLVAEYIEDAGPADAIASACEVVRPRVVAEYVDSWTPDEDQREFTVLLRDKTVVTVRGHELEMLPNAVNPSESASYAVIVHQRDRDLTVALFPVGEVSGVFNGDVQANVAVHP